MFGLNGKVGILSSKFAGHRVISELRSHIYAVNGGIEGLKADLVVINSELSLPILYH